MTAFTTSNNFATFPTLMIKGAVKQSFETHTNVWINVDNVHADI